MEQGKPSTPVERDFLDLRLSLAEIAGGAFTLVSAICASLFALSLAYALSARSAVAGPAGLAVWVLLLLLALCAALGLWLLYAKGRKGALCKTGLRLCRVLPIAEAVLCVLGAIAVAALLLVTLFSNSLLLSSLRQAAAGLQGSFFVFGAQLLAAASTWALELVVAAIVALCALFLLYALRVFLLCRFQKKLAGMEAENLPRKSPAGAAAIFSWIFALCFLALGAAAISVNTAGGLLALSFGLLLFANGLLLKKAAVELRFLHTYYAKLNRAVRRRAEAIRAQTEALMNAPLAIAAPEEDAPGASLPDIPSGEEAPDVIEAGAAAEAEEAEAVEAEAAEAVEEAVEENIEEGALGACADEAAETEERAETEAAEEAPEEAGEAEENAEGDAQDEDEAAAAPLEG